MLLSDIDLRTAMNRGDLVVRPFNARMLQPASIDVHLANEFRVFPPRPGGFYVDTRNVTSDLTSPLQVPDTDGLILKPGDLILGSTVEWFTIGESLAGRLEGRSSLGRLGLLTHSTAGFIDPGFSGTITLELANVSRTPIILHPGMSIGQLCVIRLTSRAERPYGSAGLESRYQGQIGPTPSRYTL